MKVARKLLVTGAASLVFAGGILAFPSALPVSATHGSHDNSRHGPGRHTDGSYVLKEESNATYNVKTKINPRHHIVWSTVTNKTDTPLTPVVTFNGEPATTYSDEPLDPGESRKYAYLFTGNNFGLDVTVTAEGTDPFTSSVVVNLPEPVSFSKTATDATNKTVTGNLTNNTADTQTVYLKEGRHNKTVETLNPNETKTVTISAAPKDTRHWNKEHDRKFIWFSVSTETGYKGSYIVPLVPTIDPPVPLED